MPYIFLSKIVEKSSLEGQKIDETFELESHLIDKINNDNWYLENFEDSKSNLIGITISKRNEVRKLLKKDSTFQLEFKDSTTNKEAKDFLNICLLFDGYKIICERLKIDFSSYIDWLNSVIDNYLTNQLLLIDEKFFTIEIGFLSYMIIYLSRFERFTIKLKFLDENYINIFMEVFTKTINNKTKIEFKKLSFLKVLKFVNNDLTDDLFKEHLLDIFEITPALTELEISKNYISGDSLSELSFYFRNSLKCLEKLNFSNNWIDSFGLEDFLDKSLNHLPKLVSINLSQNFLDNEFLKHFDLFLRKNKVERTQDILIDLTKNRFDSHLLRFKFFKWKPEEEIEKNERSYSVYHFVENLTKMKAKLKIKLDMVKHYREKESDVTKKVLDNIKSYTIKVKTTNEGIPENSTSLSLYKELDEMLTEIDQYFDPISKSKLLASDTYLDKSKDSSISDIFNPSNNIEDFNSIFKKIKNFKMNITYIQIHKFINKLKIISYQSIRDKNIYDMNYLNKICEYFKTSNMEKLHTEYLKLQTRSKIIMEALNAILNFEGNLLEKNKNFFHEMNNFLDLFLHEADNINLKNDLILIAKYIQFIRNNKIRSKLFSIYENILKEESLMNSNDRAAEFDMIYKKYKDISDYKVLRIPDEIKVKILSLHPNKLDYLVVCDSRKDELDFDLVLVSKNLKDDESYGLRNIHDRIHFLLSYTSDRNLDPNSKFYLNKNNNFLKISRVIFRYLNNLDFNLLFKDSHYFEYVAITKGSNKYDFSNIDKDSVLNFGKIRIPNEILDQGGDLYETKLKILTFSSEIIKESLIHCEEGKEKEFNELAIAFNTKLLRIFEQDYDEQNLNKLKKSLKEFLTFFIHVKEHYKSDTQFVDDLNQEIVLQLYKLLNRNDFKEETIKIKNIFGFLNVLSYLINLSPAFLNSFKRWINYLIKNKYFIIDFSYYSDYCREIINNLINHNNGVIFWIPSTIEIEAKMELKPIDLKISITSDLEETYIVSETTTIADLYNDLINNSSNLSEMIEKKFYWIYLKISENEEYLPLYSEEYVLNVISCFEEAFLDRGYKNSKEILKFYLRRRIFSKYILEKDLNKMIDIELQILFEQVKETYLNKIYSSVISDSDSIELSSILLEFIRRKLRIKDILNFTSKEFVDFINNHLEKIVPRYKKEIFSVDQTSFFEKIKKTYKELSLTDKNERMMGIEFLKIIRSYEFFFSSIFSLKSKKNNNYFVLPEFFILLISVNGFLIIDEIKLEIMYKFEFHDLIYTFLNSSEPNTLFFSFIYNENSNKAEKRFKFLTEEARIITEDILSYCQLSLFTNPSKLISVKKLEMSKRNESVSMFFNLLDYNFIYQRKLACLKLVPSFTDLKKNRSSSVKLNKIINSSCNKIIDISSEIEKEKKYEKTLAKHRQNSNIDSSMISQENKKTSNNDLGIKTDLKETDINTENKNHGNDYKNSRNFNKEEPSLNENFTTNPSRYNTFDNNTINTTERKGHDSKEKDDKKIKDSAFSEANDKNKKDKLKQDNDLKNLSQKENSNKNAKFNKTLDDENKKQTKTNDGKESPSKKIENEINNKEGSQRKSILNSLISSNNQKKETSDNNTKKSTNEKHEAIKNVSPSTNHGAPKSNPDNLKPVKNVKSNDHSSSNTCTPTQRNPQNQNIKDNSIKDISDLDLNKTINFKPDPNNMNNNHTNIKTDGGKRMSRNVNQPNELYSKTNDTPSSKTKTSEMNDLNKKTIDNQIPKTDNKNSNFAIKDKDENKKDTEKDLSIKKCDNKSPVSQTLSKKNKETNINIDNDLPSFGNANNLNKGLNLNPPNNTNENNTNNNNKMPINNNIKNNSINLNSAKPGTTSNNNSMNNYNSNLVKPSNIGDKPNDSNVNSYNSNITPLTQDKNVKEEEKKDNVTSTKRESILKDQQPRRTSIQMTKRASQLLSSLNLGDNKNSTIGTDKSQDEKQNTAKEKEIEKSPINNKQATQANIKKALNLLPNKGLFTKMTNAKGIDPTSKINI